MVKITFGIIMPTYYKPAFKKHITDALNSILNQTYSNWKLFLIGDHYENYSEWEDLIKLIPKNKLFAVNLPFASERDLLKNDPRLWAVGGIYASNYGISWALSQGITHLTFLDHDDLWDASFLENLEKEYKENKNLAFVASLGKHFNGAILPNNSSENFIPEPCNLLKSSFSYNYKLLPIRFRNLLQDENFLAMGDAEFLTRANKIIKENKLQTKLIPKVLVNHWREGI